MFYHILRECRIDELLHVLIRQLLDAEKLILCPLKCRAISFPGKGCPNQYFHKGRHAQVTTGGCLQTLFQDRTRLNIADFPFKIRSQLFHNLQNLVLRQDDFRSVHDLVFGVLEVAKNPDNCLADMGQGSSTDSVISSIV